MKSCFICSQYLGHSDIIPDDSCSSCYYVQLNNLSECTDQNLLLLISEVEKLYNNPDYVMNGFRNDLIKLKKELQIRNFNKSLEEIIK